MFEIYKNPMTGYSYLIRIYSTDEKLIEIKLWLDENYPKDQYYYISDIIRNRYKTKSLRIFFKENYDEILTLLRLTWL